MGSKRAEADRRKRNRTRQANLREARDRYRLCRTCGDPAVPSPRTGKLSRSCKRHLASDKDRKGVVPLIEYVLEWSR